VREYIDIFFSEVFDIKKQREILWVILNSIESPRSISRALLSPFHLLNISKKVASKPPNGHKTATNGMMIVPPESLSLG
jgi:hypothetical protein